MTSRDAAPDLSPDVTGDGYEWGVWSNTEDGFIETQCYSHTEAIRRCDEINTAAGIDPESDEAADLSPRRICPDHDEQPADACEECEA